MKFFRMKKSKFVLIAGIFIFCSTTLFAQITLDVKAHLGYPVYLESDEPERDFSYNYTAVMGVEYAINEYFGIQSGFMFSMKRINYKDFLGDDEWCSMSVPLYAKLKVPTEYAEFYLLVGPNFEYFLDPGFLSNIIVDNNFLFGYSAEIGAGFPIVPNQGSLLVGLHCGSHFTKLYDNHQVDILTIDLVLGYSQKL